jgi:hypothetical protein
VAEVETRALAGKKLEAPPDAGHEQTEGETVRGETQTVKRRRIIRLAGFGPRVLDTTKAFSDLARPYPHRWGEAKSSGS